MEGKVGNRQHKVFNIQKATHSGGFLYIKNFALVLPFSCIKEFLWRLKLGWDPISEAFEIEFELCEELYPKGVLLP